MAKSDTSGAAVDCLRSNSPFDLTNLTFSSDEEDDGEEGAPRGLWCRTPRFIRKLLRHRDCLVCVGAANLERDEGHQKRHWPCDLRPLLDIDRNEALGKLNSPSLPSVCTPFSTAKINITDETDDVVLEKIKDLLKQNLQNTWAPDDFDFRAVQSQRIHCDTLRFIFMQLVYFDYYGLMCINSRTTDVPVEMVSKDEYIDPYVSACRDIYVALFGNPMRLEQQAYGRIEERLSEPTDVTDFNVAPGIKKKLQSTYWHSRDSIVQTLGEYAGELDSDALFVVIDRELNVACGFYCYMSRMYG